MKKYVFVKSTQCSNVGIIINDKAQHGYFGVAYRSNSPWFNQEPEPSGGYPHHIGVEFVHQSFLREINPNECSRYKYKFIECADSLENDLDITVPRDQLDGKTD